MRQFCIVFLFLLSAEGFSQSLQDALPDVLDTGKTVQLEKENIEVQLLSLVKLIGKQPAEQNHENIKITIYWADVTDSENKRLDAINEDKSFQISSEVSAKVNWEREYGTFENIEVLSIPEPIPASYWGADRDIFWPGDIFFPGDIFSPKEVLNEWHNDMGGAQINYAKVILLGIGFSPEAHIADFYIYVVYDREGLSGSNK